MSLSGRSSTAAAPEVFSRHGPHACDRVALFASLIGGQVRPPFEAARVSIVTVSDQQFRDASAALIGPDGPELMELMCRLRIGVAPKLHDHKTIVHRAVELGWIDARSVPTPLGMKIGDSCREFVFWNERGRKVHAWQENLFLDGDSFSQKRVLEIGCGCATNLFHLQEISDFAVGLDIEFNYLRFASVLAGIAGVATPRCLNASAECMPFESGSFDVTVCFGSLQYMDIQRVLSENVRVLRTGGEALWTLSDLRSYSKNFLRRLRKSRIRAGVREGITLAGMVAYPWIGRAFTRAHDPVYPSFHRMAAWLDDAGFQLDAERTRKCNGEVTYVARKR